VVNETTDVAHAVAVDDDAAVKVDTVMMSVIAVLLRHTSSELLLAHHLTHVLRYKLAYTPDKHQDSCALLTVSDVQLGFNNGVETTD